MFYSKSRSGFYDAAIHGNEIPSDAVEITSEEHAKLLNGQANGKIIAADASGHPFLQEPPAPTSEKITEAVTIMRANAYAKESDPLFFKSQRGEATTEEWLAKIEEIKARFPDGVMPFFPST